MSTLLVRVVRVSPGGGQETVINSQGGSASITDSIVDTPAGGSTYVYKLQVKDPFLLSGAGINLRRLVALVAKR
ncbi:hypothetical protein [Limobrevibacterium gyesilva]|uniref:Uncharacterized protein n=1 Tax=Limobrevibacterium gyesilva TaxID=2991712 RepID=A0AA41YY13_9PROT|nr:hypothetical protein [Limobrevibacterium gyesilva]MCW3477372.1 hypothetical protein [Limobrevibacterium gyesilva]